MNRVRVVRFVWLCSALVLAACGGDDKKLELGGSCTLNSDCVDGLLCKFGACHKACVKSVDCATGERCVQVDGVAVCQASACAPGCPAPLVCNPADQTCRNTCSPTSYCLGGQVCTAGMCFEFGEADAGQSMDAGGADIAATPDTAPAAADLPVATPDTTVTDAPLATPDTTVTDAPLATPDAPIIDSPAVAIDSTRAPVDVARPDTTPSSVCTPACTVGQACVSGQCTACGRSAGQPCCDDTPCSANLTCNNANRCVCGDADQACCEGSKCTTGLACETGTCKCGGFGSACCAGNTCTAGGVCAGLRCGCVQSCDDGFYWKTDGTFRGGFALTNADGSARTSATSLAIGNSSTACIVANDETVWCQGSNAYGQLGNGDVTITSSTKLVQVLKGAAPSGAPLTGIKKVASGGYAALGSHDSFCALSSAGGIWCWGMGTNGQLGTGNTLNSSFAVSVLDAPGSSPMANVADLVVGSHYACALKVDGTVWCWGNNCNGMLGTGAAVDTNNPSPAKVLAITEPVVSVSSSNSTMVRTTCAIDTKKSVWCWGYQAGPDGAPGDNLAPIRLAMSKNGAAFTDAVQVDANNRRVRKADGTLWQWDATSVTPLTENSIPVSGSFHLGRDCWIGSDGNLRGISATVTCP